MEPDFDAWEPPTPVSDPREVLHSAKRDASEGRYRDALAKRVWFHRNALRLRPSLYGVRLSFALRDWVELGLDYPAAVSVLGSIRDDCEYTLRADLTARESFQEFCSINWALDEPCLTRDLFAWLSERAPEQAAAYYQLAQPALITCQDYELCNRFLDPAASFEESLTSYERKLLLAENPRFPSDMSSRAERDFVRETGALIALLVACQRAPEAAELAEKAIARLDSPWMRVATEQGLRGHFPGDRLK